MVYAPPGIWPVEWDAQCSLGFWDTNRSSDGFVSSVNIGVKNSNNNNYNDNSFSFTNNNGETSTSTSLKRWQNCCNGFIARLRFRSKLVRTPLSLSYHSGKWSILQNGVCIPQTLDQDVSCHLKSFTREWNLSDLFLSSFLRFVHAVIRYQLFISNTNNFQPDLLDPEIGSKKVLWFRLRVDIRVTAMKPHHRCSALIRFVKCFCCFCLGFCQYLILFG